jgi:predicted phosphodiesterase
MRVGVIPDLHLPFEHPLFLEFCLDSFSSWRVDTIHFTGDIVDAHALSFHDREMDAHGAEQEAAMAEQAMLKWKKAFPEATVSIGNHDRRHYNRAKKYGIPTRYMRTYEDIWKTPSWSWDLAHEMDGVLYEHGECTSGKNAAYNRALLKRQSIVIGHIHTFAGVTWHMSDKDRIFGMNAGCGININEYAFEYAKQYVNRPCLGCGVVLDGEYAYWEPMPCGVKEAYHKKRA